MATAVVKNSARLVTAPAKNQTERGTRFSNNQIGNDAWRAEVRRLNAHAGETFANGPIVSTRGIRNSAVTPRTTLERNQSIDTSYRNAQRTYSSITRSRAKRLARKQSQGDETSFGANATQTTGQPFAPLIRLGKPSLQKAKGMVTVTARVIRAVSVASVVLIPLFFLQVVLWALAMAGIGIQTGAEEFAQIVSLGESTFQAVTGYIPGYELFSLAWGINVILSFIAIAIALASLSHAGIRWYQGKWIVLTLACTVALYANPFTQMLPWVFLLMFLIWLDHVSETVLQ